MGPKIGFSLLCLCGSIIESRASGLRVRQTPPSSAISHSGGFSGSSSNGSSSNGSTTYTPPTTATSSASSFSLDSSDAASLSSVSSDRTNDVTAPDSSETGILNDPADSGQTEVDASTNTSSKLVVPSTTATFGSGGLGGSSAWNSSLTSNTGPITASGLSTGVSSTRAPFANTTHTLASNATCYNGICVDDSGAYLNGSSLTTALPTTFWLDCYLSAQAYSYSSSALLSSLSIYLTAPGVIVSSTKVFSYESYNLSTTTFSSYSTASNGLVSSFGPLSSWSTGMTTSTSTILDDFSVLQWPDWFTQTPVCCGVASEIAAESAPAYTSASEGYAAYTMSISSSIASEYGLTIPTTTWVATNVTSLITTTSKISFGYYDSPTGGDVYGIHYYLPDGILRVHPTSAGQTVLTTNVTSLTGSETTIGGGWGLSFPPVTDIGYSSPWSCGATYPAASTVAGNTTTNRLYDCGGCSIYADNVALLYWPVALTWHGSQSTVISEVPATTTQVVGNQTLTYPTLYLSYAAISASDSCGPIGTAEAGAIISISPNDLDIVWFVGAIGAGEGFETGENAPVSTTLNLGALAPNPLPASNYLAQEQCENACLDLIADDWPYAPQLVLPSELRSLQPAWASCAGYLGGSYDPPSALQPVSAPALPTVVSDSSSIPAAPASTTGPGLPSSTGANQIPSATSTADPSAADPSAADPSIADPSTAAELSAPIGSTSRIITVGITTIVSSNTEQTGTTPAADPASADTAPATPAPSESATSTLTIGGQSISANPSSSGGGIVVGSTTLTPGIATTISGVSISVGSSSVVVGSSTIALPTSSGTDSAPAAATPLTSVGGVTVSADPSGAGVVIGSQTLAPGASTTIRGTPVSVGTGSVVVGGSTIAVPTASASGSSSGSGSVITNVGGTPLSAEPNGNGVIVSGQTLEPGQSTVFSGTAVSVGTGSVVVGSQTIVLPSSVWGVTEAPKVTTVGGVSIVAASVTGSNGAAGVVVDGTTLTSGQSAVVEGTAVSVGSGVVVVAGSTMAIPGQGTAIATVGAVDVSADTANPSDVVVDGKTLAPGDATVIDGKTVSVGTSAVVVDGTTIPIPTTTSTVGQGSSGGLVTVIGAHEVSADANGNGVDVDGVVVTPGQNTVVDGTTVIVASGDVVVGSQTFLLPASITTVLGGETATVLPNGGVIVDGTSLRPGLYATIDGVRVSEGEGELVVGSSTFSLPATDALIPMSVVSGDIVVGGSTLSVGGPAVTSAGHTFSAAANGLTEDGTLVVSASLGGGGEGQGLASLIMAGLADGSLAAQTATTTTTTTSTSEGGKHGDTSQTATGTGTTTTKASGGQAVSSTAAAAGPTSSKGVGAQLRTNWFSTGLIGLMACLPLI